MVIAVARANESIIRRERMIERQWQLPATTTRGGLNCQTERGDNQPAAVSRGKAVGQIGRGTSASPGQLKERGGSYPAQWAEIQENKKKVNNGKWRQGRWTTSHLTRGSQLEEEGIDPREAGTDWIQKLFRSRRRDRLPGRRPWQRPRGGRYYPDRRGNETDWSGEIRNRSVRREDSPQQCYDRERRRRAEEED
jgi:hypothetical protein